VCLWILVFCEVATAYCAVPQPSMMHK